MSRKPFIFSWLDCSLCWWASQGGLSHLSFLPQNEVVQVLEKKIAPAKETPLPNQAQADNAAREVDENYDPLLTGSEYEELQASEIIPKTVTKVQQKAPAVARYEIISEEQRVHAINKHVRLVMIDDTLVEGLLTGISEDSVVVESVVGGGSLGSSYPDDQIKSFSVRLAEGEKLYEASEEEKAVEEDILNDNIPAQLETPKVNAGDIAAPEMLPEALPLESRNSESLELIQDQAMAVPEPEYNEQNSEVLEKIEDIVDDTELLDPVDGQP